jgi:ATP-dependent DNA helicase RecG
LSTLDEIKKGESKTIEFKEVFMCNQQVAKSFIAFSNGAGGKLIIGVKDKTKEIIGISENDVLELPDRISNNIYDMCCPTIIPEIYVENIDGKNIMVVKIYPGNLKPYYLKNKGKVNGTYIRVGATNRLADEEMILELERQKRNISFDEESLYDYDFSDINFNKLKNEFAGYTGKRLDDKDLITLKLVKEENGKKYPTRAAVLLSGNNSIFEYARIRCARFKGNDIGEFIDQKEFDGSLHIQVENAMKFAMIHIEKTGKIDGLKRTDEYLVPLVAVREALINAVVHRDYSISGSDIKFAVFDTRIEITSPGNLPKSLSVDEVIMGRSEIRNKVIARFFKEIGFIEQWGTGLKKIINSCILLGLKKPEFIETGLFFKVIIFKSSDKVAISSDKAISGDKVSIIVEYLKIHKTITNVTAREITGLSSSGVRKIFSNMLKNGLIKAFGEKKNRYYVLSD